MADQLKFFQEVGRDYLASKTRALLADQMRLGKTPQAITACDKVRASKVLVACPAIARPVWKEHFKEWSSEGRSIQTLTNPGQYIEAENTVAIASYDYIRSNKADLVKNRWDVLIPDESHFLKSINAQRTKAIFAKGGLGWFSDRIWCLSGTPAPNNPSELWPILTAFGLIRMTYYDFVNYFCTTNGDGKPTGARADHVEELRAIIKKFTLRRLKKQVAPELPECTLEDVPVESSTEFLDLIRPIECDDMMIRAQGQARDLKIALDKIPADQHAQYMTLNADNYVTLRRVNAILKTPAAFETIKFEIENNLVDKLVIFCYHREPIKLLANLLPAEGIKTGVLYGGTPEKKRESAIKAFKRPSKEGGSRVLVCQILAAGTAIDLSVACEGIALEEDWVPGNNAQAFERMGGYKQTNPISIRKLYLPDSIDVEVARTLTRKEKELSSIFD